MTGPISELFPTNNIPIPLKHAPADAERVATRFIHDNTGIRFTTRSVEEPDSYAPLVRISMKERTASVVGDARVVSTVKLHYRAVKGPEDEKLFDEIDYQNRPDLKRLDVLEDRHLQPGEVTVYKDSQASLIIKASNPGRIRAILQKGGVNDPGLLRIDDVEPDERSTIRLQLHYLGKKMDKGPGQPETKITVDVEEKTNPEPPIVLPSPPLEEPIPEETRAVKPPVVHDLESDQPDLPEILQQWKIDRETVAQKFFDAQNLSGLTRQNGHSVDGDGRVFVPVEGRPDTFMLLLLSKSILKDVRDPNPLTPIYLGGVHARSGEILMVESNAVIDISSSPSAHDDQTPIEELPLAQSDLWDINVAELLAGHDGTITLYKHPKANIRAVQYDHTIEIGIENDPEHPICVRFDRDILQATADSIRDKLSHTTAPPHPGEPPPAILPESAPTPPVIEAIAERSGIAQEILNRMRERGRIKIADLINSLRSVDLHGIPADILANMRKRKGLILASGLELLLLFLKQSAPSPEQVTFTALADALAGSSRATQGVVRELAKDDLAAIEETVGQLVVSRPPPPEPKIPLEERVSRRVPETPQPADIEVTVAPGDSIWNMADRQLDLYFPGLPDKVKKELLLVFKNYALAIDARAGVGPTQEHPVKPGDKVRFPGEDMAIMMLDELIFKPGPDTQADRLAIHQRAGADVRTLRYPGRADDEGAMKEYIGAAQRLFEWQKSLATRVAARSFALRRIR